MSTDRSSPSGTSGSSATEALIPAARPRPRRHIGAALVAAALAALPPAAAPLGAAVVEEIVAKINNRIVTMSELEERTQALARQIAQEYSGPDFDRELRASQEVLLANIITENLLIERAESIFDMDKIRESLLEDFRKQQKIETDADLEKALKDQGITRKELEDQLIRMAVPNEIINYDVKKKISVSETEMKTYYDAHLDRWTTPATVTFREIVLLYGGDRRDVVHDRAEEIVREARAGTDFLQLVQEYSEAGTRETAGLIGPVPAGDLLPEIARAAFDLKPGEISDPIDTSRSFHILRLDASTQTIVKLLATVHDEVYAAVREEKFRPRFDKYLKKLWTENYIEVEPKYENLLVVTPLKPKAAA